MARSRQMISAPGCSLSRAANVSEVRSGPAVPGQHVHDPAGFDVDQHGSVGAALAEGELVHPQHPRRTVRHRRAVSGRSSRVRPAARLRRRHSRAAGRPPSSIDRSQLVSPVLERRYRVDRPGTCSTNVVREQLLRSQKYRRTRSRTTSKDGSCWPFTVSHCGFAFVCTAER